MRLATGIRRIALDNSQFNFEVKAKSKRMTDAMFTQPSYYFNNAF